MPDFNPKAVVEKHYRKALNAMSRMVQLGVVATQYCMADAGLKKGTLPSARFGVEFAAVMAATEIDDFAVAGRLAQTDDPRTINMPVWGKEGLDNIAPMWMLKYLPNMPA